MHTPYLNRNEFEQKADALAAALALERSEAQGLLARVSGYEDAAAVAFGDRDRSLCSSREELIARLQASRPDIESERASDIIDQLRLRVRDADMEHIPASPGAVPNMGG